MVERRGKQQQLPMYLQQDERYKTIAGNAPNDVKQTLADTLGIFMARGHGFADAIGGRVRITDVDIHKKLDEPEKLEAKVVCELDVEEDMLNGGGNVHGGCSAYLIDICSTLPITALIKGTGRDGLGGVSQVINVVYHSPARLGERLRIVSTTIALGARAMSARCEIWNQTQHRLVASGVHIKMEASNPKL